LRRSFKPMGSRKEVPANKRTTGAVKSCHTNKAHRLNNGVRYCLSWKFYNFLQASQVCELFRA